MIFTVGLADKRIRIQSIYPELKDFFKDYIIDDEMFDLSVSWSEEDISAEQKRSEESGFSLSYLETLVALRKIAELLPTNDCFLMHGASITYEDKAFLFTAASGTGKSTHIRLWKKYLGDKVQIVNGDKPFLSVDKEQKVAYIYGTPWAGKENWQKNRKARLHGICFLNRGVSNRIRPISPSDCIPLLLNQIYMPENSDAAGATLELMDTLTANVPLYYLECDISEDAVQCSFEAMCGLPFPTE